MLENKLVLSGTVVEVEFLSWFYYKKIYRISCDKLYPANKSILLQMSFEIHIDLVTYIQICSASLLYIISKQVCCYWAFWLDLLDTFRNFLTEHELAMKRCNRKCKSTHFRLENVDRWKLKKISLTASQHRLPARQKPIRTWPLSEVSCSWFANWT